jgi:hypothetical protein
MRGSFGKGQEGKSLLFLKKKKQKNFFPLGSVGRRRGVPGVETWEWTKVFLLLFFEKKKILALLPAAVSAR